MRIIKLYINENKYKEFLTCSNDFTKYYFNNWIQKRVCILINETFQSINFDKEDYLNYDSFYLHPKKEFYFQQVIELFSEIKWDDPPEELEFVIKKGKYNNKIKNPIINYGNRNIQTFFHNSKIGITTSIISDLYEFYLAKYRVLYFNSSEIYSSDNYKRKKYFLFFLCLLFFEKESEKAIKFLIEIYYNYSKYENIEALFSAFLELFKDNDSFIIIFDDIHSKEHYESINKLKNIINKFKKEKKIFIREFIEINKETLSIINEFYESNKTFETIRNNKNIKLIEDLTIISELNNNNNNCLDDYKNKIRIKINKILKNLDDRLNLIKLFYYLSNDILKDLSKVIILFDEIKDFIEFLNINISNISMKLEFRNKIIEYYFKLYYNYNFEKLFFEESKNFIFNKLKSEEGFSFERQIILSISISKMMKLYSLVNVQRIYCLEKIKNFKVNGNILFYQTNESAPLYDFAILVRNSKGEYILKAYQATIKKPTDELNKLIRNKIIYDLSYFIEKIRRILKIEIKGFTFGIIKLYKDESYNTDDNNIEIIFNFCTKNNYEFILYDMNNDLFLLNKYKNENDSIIKFRFKKIRAFEEINSIYNEPIHIFNENCKIYKKYYIE